MVETTAHMGLVDQEPAMSRTITCRAADAIAWQIVVILERHSIETLDDLANNDRLRMLAGIVLDALPRTVRFPVTQAVGREFVEDRIMDLLLAIRASLPPEARTSDLKRVARLQAPVIAAQIDAALDAAVNHVGSAFDRVGSFVQGNLSSAREFLRWQTVASVFEQGEELPAVPAPGHGANA